MGRMLMMVCERGPQTVLLLVKAMVTLPSLVLPMVLTMATRKEPVLVKLSV